MSASSVGIQFREMTQEMGVTPILPPDVNSPTQLASANISAFSRAVNNDVKPAAAPILPANDGQQLANDAMQVSQNLGANAKETVGMKVPQSDATYLGSQVGQAVSQVATGLSSILGAEAKDAQEIRQNLLARRVGDIARVTLPAFEWRHGGRDPAGFDAAKSVELFQPVRIALHQVIVDRNNVDATPGQRIEIGRQGGNQRFAFTGSHLSDFSLV